MSGKADSLKTIFYALGANFVIFLCKLAAAVFTGSGALLAEAIHSLADCGNQILLLWGVRQSKRPPSPDYPLGHGREVYFWSFMVALLLFSIGGVFSLSEGWHKLHDPQPLTMPWLAVGVLVFGIVAESMSMRACLQEIAKARGGRSIYRWFRESRQAELVVIFGEDLAALFGLAFALGAVVLTMLTGNPLYDAIGTLAIGVLLIAVALFVAIEVKGLLVGQGVDPAVHRAIYAWLNDRAEIRGVLSLITLQLGEQVMVSVQAQMDFSQRGDELIRQINVVERALKQQFPAVRWMFFEPDETD